jgi:AraC family transcriptional regulator
VERGCPSFRSAVDRYDRAVGAGNGSGEQTASYERHLNAVNCAIDAIMSDLSSSLRLGDLASSVGFSPFHFHRIFSALTGESPAEFTMRVRIQRALYLMAYEPTKSMTDVAAECGFGSLSTFSTAFKKAHGAAPTKFDLSPFGQADSTDMIGSNRISALPAEGDPNLFDVEIRSLPSRPIGYMRETRPYEGDRVPQVAHKLV